MDDTQTTTNPANPANPVSQNTTDANTKRKSRISILPSIKDEVALIKGDVTGIMGDVTTVKDDVTGIKELLLSKEKPKCPKFNPEETNFFKYWFGIIPSYYFKVLCRTPWLRMFLWLVLTAFTTVLFLLWHDLYSDNCTKQAELSRLEVVETKYQTLKSWAEKDKEWRLRFLIIDRCYSDTAYYRDDIIAIQNHIKGKDQKK